MALNKALFSSDKEDWATPQDFFDSLNEEFHFNLDPCADPENAKCDRFFTKEENGLLKDWGGSCVFCNPPYGRKTTGEWIEKCYKEAQKENTTVVALIPARTDTKFFHDYIYGKAEIRFIKGRLKFGNSKDAAPFPSMVIIFRKEESMDAIKQKIYELTETELKAANEKFPLFASSHEAYGVIFEEFDETRDELELLEYSIDQFWSDVKENSSEDVKNDRLTRIYEKSIDLAVEAIQTAAMARKGILSSYQKGDLAHGEKTED